MPGPDCARPVRRGLKNESRPNGVSNSHTYFMLFVIFGGQKMGCTMLACRMCSRNINHAVSEMVYRIKRILRPDCARPALKGASNERNHSKSSGDFWRNNVCVGLGNWPLHNNVFYFGCGKQEKVKG